MRKHKMETVMKKFKIFLKLMAKFISPLIQEKFILTQINIINLRLVVQETPEFITEKKN